MKLSFLALQNLATLIILLIFPFKVYGFKYELTPTPLVFNNQIIISSDTCPTGLETSIWYMGTHGIDWRSGTPQPDSFFYSALGIGEGHSSICDKQGNLLFYSDNDYIYNRNHQIMAGCPRFSNPSSVMCAIVPQPGSDSLYYFFSPDNYPTLGAPPYKLRYVQIDMSQDSGLGAVVTPEQVLIDSSSEQVLAVKHCNGRDWWIICQNAVTEVFYSFLLDTSGIQFNQIVTSISGNIHNISNEQYKTGELAISNSGEYLIECTLGHPSQVELHQFDPSTGIISNGYDLFDTITTAKNRKELTGAAFSADDSKVYLTSADTFDVIFQVDLLDPDSSVVRKRINRIIHQLGFGVGGPVLGRDDRIYITTFMKFFKTLHVIHQPNEYGQACELKLNDFYLGGKSGLSAPNFAVGLERPYRAVVQGKKIICKDSLAHFLVKEACPHVTEWMLPDGGNIVNKSGDSLAVMFLDTGMYRVIAAYPIRCGFKSDTHRVQVNRCHCAHQFSLTQADTLVCVGNTSTISFKTNASSYLINGILLPNPLVTIPDLQKDTLLKIYLTYPDACDTLINVKIRVIPIDSSHTVLEFCQGDSVYIQNQWYHQDDELRILLSNKLGCDSVVLISLKTKQSESFTTNLKICEGDSVWIFNPNGGKWITSNESDTIIWNNQEGCDSIYVYNVAVFPSFHETLNLNKCIKDSVFYQGTYYLHDTSFLSKYSSQYGCDSIVSINIINYPISPASRTIHNICNGDSIQIDNIWYHDSTIIITHFNNQYGCDSFHMTEIHLYPIPEPTTITFYYCIGDSVQIEQLWYTTASEFTVHKSNIHSCDSLIHYKVIPYEDIYVDLDDTLELIYGGTHTLSGLHAMNVNRFRWFPSEYLSCTECQNPEITAIHDGTYSLEVSDGNGCTAIDSIFIRVKNQTSEIYIPNIFSPNADSKNDTWNITFSDSRSKIISIQLFERWGQQVYSCKSHPNGMGSNCNGWDGMVNNHPCLPNVYIYLINWENAAGQRFLIKGDVTLIR
ncbi:MAG: gliding motility-associated C-terminal domain-containing protein [Saprospiraceae bacterium]|nr:gliding motility-associated C-terminal domain-containing protein [Candidatus Vicinibacter proximus]